MRFTKTQQETYDDLMALLQRRGRGFLLGWALGLIIALAQHDPTIRRAIKRQLKDPDS